MAELRTGSPGQKRLYGNVASSSRWDVQSTLVGGREYAVRTFKGVTTMIMSPVRVFASSMRCLVVSLRTCGNI